VTVTGGSEGAAPRLVVVEDPAALARAAAEEIGRRAAEAVAPRGAFHLALSGGETPRALYALLAAPAGPYRGRVPWPRVHAWFGDERHVPPDHPDSNFRMANEALLAHVPLAAVYRIEGERPADEAAARYEALLEEHLPREGGRPRLDLALQGLGADGHTASLFPGSPALEERDRLVVAPFVPHLRAHRITLTFPALAAARAVIFVVAGAEKAAPLARLLRPVPGEPPIPAARLRPTSGDRLVLADRAAAGAG
jgi:6-phosphogluconolactonase